MGEGHGHGRPASVPRAVVRPPSSKRRRPLRALRPCHSGRATPLAHPSLKAVHRLGWGAFTPGSAKLGDDRATRNLPARIPFVPGGAELPVHASPASETRGGRFWTPRIPAQPHDLLPEVHFPHPRSGEAKPTWGSRSGPLKCDRRTLRPLDELVGFDSYPLTGLYVLVCLANVNSTPWPLA